jgi:ribonuclease HI
MKGGTHMNIAIIHCDGSFNRHSGIGGYGVVIQLNSKLIEFSERCEGTTSSARAEMLGAIRAIQVCGPKADRLQIYTDHKSMVDGANKYLIEWIKNNRLSSIANKDLWLELLGLMRRYTIEWFWTKGHDGDYWNERADTLAKEALLESSW